jgi:signal transduction histidine kinase
MYKLFNSIFVAIILFWIGGEIYFFLGKPAGSPREEHIHQALERSAAAFDQTHDALVRETEAMASRLWRVLRESDENTELIAGLLRSSGTLWGASLYKNGELMIWEGHSVVWNPPGYRGPVYSTIQRTGNATYFLVQAEIYTDLHVYHLVNTRLISRDNQALRYLVEDFDLSSEWDRRSSLPIDFAFLTTSPDRDMPFVRYLSTGSVDSVGFAYLRTRNLEVLIRDWEDRVRQFRSAILSVILLSLFILYFTWSRRLSSWPRTGVNLLGVVILWITLYLLRVPHRWLLTDGATAGGTASGGEPLLNLLISVVFYSLITYILLSRLLPLKRLYGIYWLPRTIIFGSLYGLFCGFALPWTVYMIFRVITGSDISLLDLNVLPGFDTWLFYHAAGFLMAALIIFCLGTGWFLMNTEQNNLGWFRPLVLTTFIISYFFTRFVFIGPAWSIGYDIWLTLAFLGSFAFTYYLHRNPNALRYTSYLRLVSWATMVSVVALFPFLLHGVTLRQDLAMEEAGRSYINISDATAEDIATRLLTRLSADQDLIELATSESSLPITHSLLRQRIAAATEPGWLGYAIGGFLIGLNGEVVDGYTSRSHLSDLYYPAFITASERYVRQIARDPANIMMKVEPDPSVYDFPIFYKGAARLGTPDAGNDAWLVVYVFVERSVYGRPINDALAAHNRDRILLQNRFYVAEYRNGSLVRAIESESAFPYPRFRRLASGDLVMLASEGGGRIVRNLQSGGTCYREMLLQIDDQTVVLINATRPSYQNLAFSFFRLLFSVLFSALFLFMIYQILVNRQWRLFRISERFQNRILDSYLLATLGFLFMMVITTEYIVSQQNIRMVEQELMQDIELLIGELQETGEEPGAGLLEVVAARLNLDAFIYEDRMLTVSTAPDLFRQQLLSYYLPFSVYKELYVQNRTTTFLNTYIGNTPLLVSYTLLDPSAERPRVIAVPAYTRSARFEEQLLQTTSFLIAIYIFIFGFFIAGAVIISRQLSKPLAEFRSGLQRISSGHLDTIIPVTTRDEIGELANAYNVMVYKLKDLQDELADVERQAAWTEMARHVAHEIKNPLTPMKLSIQHLQRQVAAGDKSIEELRPLIDRIGQTLIEQMESLNNIASDFSRYAKPLSGNFENGNLNEVILSTVELYRHDSKIDIRCNLTRDELLISCVPDELKRVFINLVKNSAEAMPGGGTIILQTTRHDGRAYAEVIDNGVGIPPENQSRIFTPNFSSKTSGTGLGLAISKKIVEAHNGDIGFASAPGAGTTFTLSFPLAGTGAADAAGNTPDLKSAPGGGS